MLSSAAASSASFTLRRLRSSRSLQPATSKYVVSLVRMKGPRPSTRHKHVAILVRNRLTVLVSDDRVDGIHKGHSGPRGQQAFVRFGQALAQRVRHTARPAWRHRLHDTRNFQDHTRNTCNFQDQTATERTGRTASSAPAPPTAALSASLPSRAAGARASRMPHTFHCARSCS